MAKSTKSTTETASTEAAGHNEVSNISESSGQMENAFQGENISSLIESSGAELVSGSEAFVPQESSPESGNELDAWYASYPEDLKELGAEAIETGVFEVVIGNDDRIRINPTTAYPWRAICSLLIKAKTGKYYIGTGWMVGPGTVITAGHCVYMHDQGGWAEWIDVMPGRNASLKPYGTIRSSNLRSTTGWTNSKNRNNDYGAIILNTKIGNTVGYFGYANKSDSFIKSKTLNLSGYPGDKPSGQQWFMARKCKSVSSRVITYEIDTAGGQSGSPVWYLEGGNRYAVGIHTNGHQSGNSATRIQSNVYSNIANWKAQGN
jgi:V8-like Glu-specific endopeptidase